MPLDAERSAKRKGELSCVFKRTFCFDLLGFRNAKISASSANSPSEATTDLSERSEVDRLQKVALIEEVDLLFHDWTQYIDESIARFDMCWNMKYGWINRTPFAGSKTEKILQDKIESSSELLEKLRGVLRIVEPDTDDWNLAITRIQSTTFKTAQMTRILSYFDRSETKE